MLVFIRLGSTNRTYKQFIFNTVSTTTQCTRRVAIGKTVFVYYVDILLLWFECN